MKSWKVIFTSVALVGLAAGAAILSKNTENSSEELPHLTELAAGKASGRFNQTTYINALEFVK